MAVQEPTSLRVCELRRPFTRDTSLHRLAGRLQLEASDRILELGGGLDGLAIPLAKDVGISVVVAEWDDAVLEALRERVRASGMSAKVEVKKVDPAALPFEQDAFFGAIVHAGAELPASQAVAAVAPFVAPEGRIAMLAVTRVGRYPNTQVMDFWSAQLGEEPRLPRELLASFNRAGVEPETAESLSDAELDAMYRAVERDLGADGRSAQLREEIALFRGQGGKSTWSFSSLVGRRRTPGERPGAPRAGA